MRFMRAYKAKMSKYIYTLTTNIYTDTWIIWASRADGSLLTSSISFINPCPATAFLCLSPFAGFSGSS